MIAPEELIQKYMDGLLTPDENTELRKMLSDEELSRLKTDKGLYDEVLKRIADAPACPELLWEHIRGKINNGQEQAPAAVKQFPSFLSFAAMLIIGFGVIGLLLFINSPDSPSQSQAFISNVQFASTIPAFAAQADVQGDPQDLLASLKKNGFDALDMSKDTMIDGHKLKALGIKYCSCSGSKKEYCSCSGHKVAQFLFECCGEQILVLVSSKEAPIGAGSFKFADMKNFHITSTEIGNYRLVAAGTHPPGEVLKLFRKPSKG